MLGPPKPRRLDQLALGADPLEEHHELELEEDHGIDAGPPALGVQLLRPVPHEAEIELRLQVAGEVDPRDELLQRDSGRFGKAAGLRRAEHSDLSRVWPRDAEPVTKARV